MFWGCISYYGMGTPVEGNMNTEKYISVLDDNQVFFCSDEVWRLEESGVVLAGVVVP